MHPDVLDAVRHQLTTARPAIRHGAAVPRAGTRRTWAREPGARLFCGAADVPAEVASMAWRSPSSHGGCTARYFPPRSRPRSLRWLRSTPVRPTRPATTSAATVVSPLTTVRAGLPYASRAQEIRAVAGALVAGAANRALPLPPSPPPVRRPKQPAPAQAQPRPTTPAARGPWSGTASRTLTGTAPAEVPIPPGLRSLRSRRARTRPQCGAVVARAERGPRSSFSTLRGDGLSGRGLSTSRAPAAEARGAGSLTVRARKPVPPRTAEPRLG
ncbi:hypothetical protein BX283_0294 [Streptomyces sp. TLI_146]|nr:hypothetical protein BX283_0294 [Streptomyces sp. TLI_146]